MDAWLNPDSEYHRLSEVPETAVLEDVYRYYLQGKQHPVPLLDIAALSQLEIPVQSAWIGTSGVIDAIQASGLVDEIIENVAGLNTPFLQYFHSTPAKYLLKAAAHKGRLGQGVDDFTAAALDRYLEGKPVNFFGVFRQLYLGGRLDLQHHLLERENMLDRALSLFLEWPDALFRQQFVDLSNFIYGIWNWEGRQTHGLSEIFLQEIKDGFEETRWQEFWALAAPRDWNAWVKLVKIAPSSFKQWLSGVDFTALGRRFRDTGSTPVSMFLGRCSQAGVAKEQLQEFYKELDFTALGRRSRNMGSTSFGTFLGRCYRAGVAKKQLQEFCKELDFTALGRRSQNTGIAAVRRLLQLCVQIGVAKEQLQEFCKELDFTALGRRSRDIRLGTVRIFLQLCLQIGVAKEQSREFCKELDFTALGQRSQDIGLHTVRTFLQLCSRLGVEKVKLQEFCEPLDWQRIGQGIIDDQNGLRSPLYNMDMLVRVEGITAEMCREVIEGMGWETLAGAINGGVSPPDLAATRLFLTAKCRFTNEELKSHGINFSSPALWFQAFAGIPGPMLDEDSPWLEMERYYNHALVRLEKNYVQQQVQRVDFSLQAWNVLIYNMIQADKNRITRDLAPVLQNFTATDYDRLIGSGSLQDLGLFLNWFNSREGIFSFQLPPGINFKGIDFLRRVEESTLESTAHFLFDFHHIDRPDLSEYFAEELKKDPELILAKIKEAELKELGFFLSNLWIAMPLGEIPFLLSDDKFLEIIKEKARQPQADEEALLGLLGVFDLSGAEPPPDLIALIDPQTAKQLCLSAAEKGNNTIKQTRLLSGLLSAYPEVLSEEESNRLKESLTQIDQTLQVPNQEFARNKILAWLSG